MGIQMIGIDHRSAVIDVRTVFSFTRTKCVEALDILIKRKGILGCILLSTCNRMELWVSTGEEFEESLYELLCEIREINPVYYREYFTERREEAAVYHLFRLTCGLESRILGEDQIITQVKEAQILAREHYTTDNVLESLFRGAVTAAKKVKANVPLAAVNPSVVHHAMDTLRKAGYAVAGKRCMVIGNGEMGRLAATLLRQSGAAVTVTVRQYRSGIVNIPKDCRRIDYGERMRLFPECDVVISATASPNYTLKKQDIEEVGLSHPVLLIDLAVPRDIEPAAGNLPFVKLYDLDYFQVDSQNEQIKQSMAAAAQILEAQIEEFYTWYECLDIIPRIQKIKANAAMELELRLQKMMKDLPVDLAQREELQKSIETATEKVVNKMMFGLRDTVSQKTFRECVEGLERVYEN